MPPSVASFIGCFNIGWLLPLFYANGVAWHFSWVALGIIISMTCYFVVMFLMVKLEKAADIQNRFAKTVLSLGYYFSVFLALLLVTVMVKIIAKHHGAA